VPALVVVLVILIVVVEIGVVVDDPGPRPRSRLGARALTRLLAPAATARSATPFLPRRTFAIARRRGGS
jgi:hypothetical protein